MVDRPPRPPGIADPRHAMRLGGRGGGHSENLETRSWGPAKYAVKGRVEITWRATAVNADGVAEGSIVVELSELPVDADELLESE
jgi:hypothetical protein